MNKCIKDAKNYLGNILNTLAVVCTKVLIVQTEEELNAVQGYFSFQSAIKDPGEGIEWKNEHAN